MNLGTLSRQTPMDCILRIVLAAVLVFAGWHVALHDLGTSSDVSSHVECHVCRLNHVPVANLPVLTLIVSLVLLSLIHVLPTYQRPIQLYRYTLGARAPPLL